MKKYISLFLATLVFIASTFFVAPSSAQAATLTLNSVTAASVSTGVDSQITNVIGQVIRKGAEYGLPLATGAIAGPGGAFLGAAGGQVISFAVDKITPIASAIGQKFPDELYIKVDGNKVWPTPNPTPKYQDIKRGQKIDLNITKNFTREASVVLWEYDTIGSDDNLGQQTFMPDSKSGEYMLFNKDEGSIYFLNVSVTP
jgi:hypothetical protein